jgi:PAS domain S-box-containing protein
MASSEQPEQPPQEPQQIEELLASPQLAAAAENDQYRRFLDHTPIAIAISRLDGDEHRVAYINRAFEALTGLTPGEVEGKTWAVLDALHHEDDPRKTLGEALAQGEDFLGVFRTEAEGAQPLAVQAYVSRIETDEGLENYRLAALVDVTARERTQREEVERHIRDKDLLLREIQHRVKNNLQLIIGLIRLEARGARRGEAINLDRLASRIESLRLLYDAMSLTGPAEDEIDLGLYLGQIAAAVMKTHAGDQIRLDLNVESCRASVNVAMPAGLAVNELLTNAFKHGFEGLQGGVISLGCRREGDERCRVTVADDGVGLPAGGSWPVPGKLGALIMETLRENAKLELEVESAPERGTRISMSFLHKAVGNNVN